MKSFKRFSELCLERESPWKRESGLSDNAITLIKLLKERREIIKALGVGDEYEDMIAHGQEKADELIKLYETQLDILEKRLNDENS